MLYARNMEECNLLIMQNYAISWQRCSVVAMQWKRDAVNMPPAGSECKTAAMEMRESDLLSHDEELILKGMTSTGLTCCTTTSIYRTLLVRVSCLCPKQDTQHIYF